MTTSAGRFVPDRVAQQRARKNGGNAKHQAVTTPEMWAEAVEGVLSRFKADMAERYAESPDLGGEAL